MGNTHPFILIIVLVVFLSGLYVYAYKPSSEGFDTTTLPSLSIPSNCPTILVKSGSAILLYNPNLPESDSNPLPFYNLDEYANYLEIQKKKGVNCPILFLQEENDAQGQNVFRIRPSPFELQGGLPYTIPPNTVADQIKNPLPYLDSDRENAPYNAGNYSGFDPTSLYVGSYTTLDKIHDSTWKGKDYSDNPADPNWGGVKFTQSTVDSGIYDENNVFPPHLIDASKMR